MATLTARTNLLERGPFKWLVTIGQVSLFFYIAHIVVYHVLARIYAMLPLPALPGIVYGYAVWLAGMVVLLIFARAYHRVRRRYPQSVLRYL